MLDSRPRGLGFEPHRCHCIVSLSKNINPSLVLVQPRKTRPFITERLLMRSKESNLSNIITCDTLICTVNHPRLTVSNWMEEFASVQSVKILFYLIYLDISYLMAVAFVKKPS